MEHLTTLFCQVDDFCKTFEADFNRTLIRHTLWGGITRSAELRYGQWDEIIDTEWHI